MPPKSTWFEPKLRSGLFVHKLKWLSNNKNIWPYHKKDWIF
jgi:hypothetical protein